MPVSPSAYPLSCHLDVPEVFVPRARYALETLLDPLGLVPRWVGRPGPDVLSYGRAARPDDPLGFSWRPETMDYFGGRVPYDASRVRWRTWHEDRWPVLFADAEGGDDLVASAFFWLSGWQEHVTSEHDVHGRFPYAASLQARLGTAARPAVDAYRERLAGRLSEAGVRVHRRTWGGRAWALCPTHDIDYLRKWRPGILYREAVEHLVLNRRGEGAGDRLRRFGRVVRDVLRPGDPCRTAFVRMHEETRARGGTATYFLKTAARDPHDVAYDPGDRFLRGRVAALLDDGFEVGLHPSFVAHTNEAYLAEERDRLAGVTGRVPRAVRQHYLRWELPATPRLHEALGFRVDSTLGFAEHEGFRHATCLPFRVYDPEADRPLGVWEMPLSVMESTLFNLRGLDASGAHAATTAVQDACRRFGGACVMLWHNTLWDEMDYPGWGRHFTESLDAAPDALVAGLETALAEWR